MIQSQIIRYFSDKIIADDEHRLTFQTLITAMMLGGIGLMMFTVNILQRNMSLALVTGILAGAGTGFSVYIHLTGRFRGVRVLMALFFVASLVYLIYSGSADGLAAYWAFLLPFMSFFIFGPSIGFMVASSLLVISLILFLTPLSAHMGYVYTGNFVIRFHLQYASCLLAAFGVEYSRHLTMLRLREVIGKLEDMTLIDDLTGIENRRSFEMRINEIWSLFQGKNNHVSLLMIDIDYFKNFNDTYGHLKGDEVLRRVAGILSVGVRDDIGFVSRWGGEEFVCLLPYADSPTAVRVAERLRGAVEAAGIEHSSSELECRTITVSIGTATVMATRDVLPRDLTQGADQSLYEAKSHGRNRLGRSRTMG